MGHLRAQGTPPSPFATPLGQGVSKRRCPGMHPHACAPLVHLGKCAEDMCRYECMREMFACCNSVGPDLLSPSVPNPRGLPSITGEAASDTCPLLWAAATPCSPSACPQPPPPGAALQSSGRPPGASCGAVGAEGRPCWQRGRSGPGAGAVPGLWRRARPRARR